MRLTTLAEDMVDRIRMDVDLAKIPGASSARFTMKRLPAFAGWPDLAISVQTRVSDSANSVSSEDDTRPGGLSRASAEDQSATITDVALRAGVSIKTVSRVVNSEPNVRSTTKQRVDQAIAELEYRPNEWARSLARRRLSKAG